MSDFTSQAWSIFIAVVTLLGLVALLGLLWSQRKQKVFHNAESGTTGHVWDEDLREYNNPLPRWWMWWFVLTIVFSLGYLVLYPGLGNFAGTKGWTSAKQYEDEVAAAQAKYQPLYDRYAKLDIVSLRKDPQAHAMGERLFLNNCSQCHGSTAEGAAGFPNLRDKDWLYGGEPETIQATISQGRQAMMPAWGETLGDEGVKDTAHYVLSLSARPHDPIRAAAGKKLFGANCAGCHGADAKGNQAMGAPNLTDHIWLYGGKMETIMETISKGRRGHMPAHEALLGPAKVKLLTAYVWGLSHEAK